MKRFFSIAFCFAAFSLPIFAAVTVNGFGRALYSPLASEDGHIFQTAGGVSWDAMYRVGFGITGDFGYTGFHADVVATETTMNGGDERKLWVKLCDGDLVLTGGVLQDNTLRGDGCFGMFDWLRAGLGHTGEDLTFRRISVTGLGIAFHPIEPLYIAIGLPFPSIGAYDLLYTYGRVQASIGYTINDLFKIKLGYFGNIKDADKTIVVTTTVDDKTVAKSEIKVGTPTGTANIALDINATQNLFISAGVFTGTDANNTEVNLYLRYMPQPLTLHGIVCMGFANDFALGAGVGVDYLISDGLQIQLDLRAQKILEDSNRNFVALAGLSKGFGNGNVGIGFEIGIKTPIATVGNNSEAHDMSFAIPVKLQYHF